MSTEVVSDCEIKPRSNTVLRSIFSIRLLTMGIVGAFACRGVALALLETCRLCDIC